MTGYESKKAAARDKLAQPAQEPVAWAVYDKRGGSKSLHWPEQHSPNGDATMFDAIPLVPQRQKVVFPTMLRKMWSGSEVQAWLDENVNKENT